MERWILERRHHQHSITAPAPKLTRWGFSAPRNSWPGSQLPRAESCRNASNQLQPSCVRITAAVLSSVKPKLICAAPMWLPLHLSNLFFYLQAVLSGNELFSINRFLFWPKRNIFYLLFIRNTESSCQGAPPQIPTNAFSQSFHPYFSLFFLG